jgi:integrase
LTSRYARRSPLLAGTLEAVGLALAGRAGSGLARLLGLLISRSTLLRMPGPLEWARSLAFSPAQVLSPLAGTPYDLRHAAVSLWLNAGVAAPDVAERAGHSVEVLFRVYAKCIDGQQDVANRRITEALSR